jgi:hypothetical protein
VDPRRRSQFADVDPRCRSQFAGVDPRRRSQFADLDPRCRSQFAGVDPRWRSQFAGVDPRWRSRCAEPFDFSPPAPQLHFVQKLVSANTVLSFSSTRRTPTLSYDLWPAHSTLDWAWSFEDCASGKKIVFMYFGLVGGYGVYYPVAFKGDFTDAYEFLLWAINWQSQNGNLYGLGEWWNFVGRPMVFDKVHEAYWASWKASH